MLFRSLHHYLPGLPYHSLGRVHRQLVRELPSDAPYRSTAKGSLEETLKRLWWRASHASGLELVSEGSIYPLLSRLQKKGYILGYFVESPGGPPRKYYRIEPTGREQLARWTDEWKTVSAGVEEVLNGGRT